MSLFKADAEPSPNLSPGSVVDVPSCLAHLWAQVNCVRIDSFLGEAHNKALSWGSIQVANFETSSPASIQFLSEPLLGSELKAVGYTRLLGSSPLVADFWALLWVQSCAMPGVILSLIASIVLEATVLHATTFGCSSFFSNLPGAPKTISFGCKHQNKESD